jgi:hypothetical protein
MFESINDVNETFVEVCEQLLRHYCIDSVGGEDEIWQIARESDEVPHFGNIYQDLIGRAVVDAINEDCPQAEASYYVNAVDTHLYAFGEMITSSDYLLGEIEEQCL